MLKYTRAFGTELTNDLSKTVKMIGFAVQGIYVIYLVYAMIISDRWTRWMNIAMFAVAFAYLIFSVIMEAKQTSKTNSDIKKKVKKVYDATKKIIFLPTIVTSIITLVTLKNDNITVSLLVTIGIILSYIVYVFGIIVERVVKSRLNRLYVAFEADIDSLLPIINKFRRHRGDEAVSIGGVDEDGSIMASFEKIIEKKEINKKEKDVEREKIRAANKVRFQQEDREKAKAFVKDTYKKSKEKIKSLIFKRKEALAQPEKENEKETVEK